MKFPTTRRTVTGLIALAGVITLALSACSPSGSSPQSTTSGSSPQSTTSGSSPQSTAAGTADALASSRAAVAKYTAVQPPIQIAPLPSAPKKNLTIAITTCPLPVCHTTTDAAAKAAEKFGWTVKNYESALTPEAYVATWNQLMQNPPNLIAYTPVVPDAAIASQLAKAASLGIPVVVMAPAGDRPSKTGPVFASYNGYPEFLQSGSLMGDVVVADGGAGANTVFIWDAALSAIWDPIKQGFTKTVAASGSSPDVVEMPTTGIGTKVPGQVVSYIQSHPNVKYVAFALADYTAGVPEALAAAGLADKVKIVSRAPQAANLANVKNGKEFATIGEENSSNGWRAIDGLARLSLGKTPDSAWFEPAGWAHIFTATNVTQTTEPPQTPGSPEAFLKAWGVG